MRYEYVLFDLDGTLCDPGPGITDAIAFAFRELGIEVPDAQGLRTFVGPPLAHTFRNYFDSDAEIEEAIRLYRQEFLSRGIHLYQVYPGIRDLLERLSGAGVHLAVATSKAVPICDQILVASKLKPLFEVVAASPLNMAVTKGTTIGEALVGLGHPDKSRVVMVGDRKHDVIGAQENGIDSVGVEYGYGDRAELEAAGATHIAETVAGLGSLLR